MAQTIWRGTLSFGLVNVPVQLVAATEDHGVHFHQLQQGTGDRIRYRRVNEQTGDEVPSDEIVRAVEAGDGYVVVSDDELGAIAPGRSEAIEVADFVDLADVDPSYFRATYYLGYRGDSGRRAYALLHRAMAETNRAGIARFVLRGKEHLVAVRPLGPVLALHTMWFADEVRDPAATVPGVATAAEVDGREVRAARQLVEALSTEWEPERYHSTYRQDLQALIERKQAGAEVTEPAPHRARGAEIVSLMDALDASLRASRQGRHGARRHADEGGKGPAEQPIDPADRSSATADLSSMTKAELTRRAADLDIRGRSSMNRSQLEEALRRAAHRRRAS